MDPQPPAGSRPEVRPVPTGTPGIVPEVPPRRRLDPERELAHDAGVSSPDPIQLDDAATWSPRLAAHVPDAPPAESPRAAVAVVLRPGPAPDVLLMQRAEREGDRWSGQVSLPGGHVDPGDVDAWACAERETREELGLDLAAHAERMGRLHAIQARARGGLLPLWIEPVVFAQTTEAPFELNHEATAVFRLPLHAAASGDLDAPFRYDRGDAVFELPSWRFEERTIWGLTHRILRGLFEVLERS